MTPRKPLNRGGADLMHLSGELTVPAGRLPKGVTLSPRAKGFASKLPDAGIVTVTAVSSIDRATAAAREARTLNEELQKQFHAGSASWEQCRRVDDRLFEALAALGE